MICLFACQIPMYGIFENIDSLEDLAKMPQWTKERPLRIATGFTYVLENFISFMFVAISDRV